MSDNSVLFFVIILIVVAIWWFLQQHKGDDGDPKHGQSPSRRATAPKVPKQNTAQQDEYLAELKKNKPGYILQAQIEFEREYRAAGGSSSFFGQEKSPLACYGYAVGKTNGRPVAERRDIIEFTLSAELPSIFPESYRIEWGAPMSTRRMKKIINHLSSLADLRSGRKNFEVAVQHWREDASWTHTTLRKKLRDLGFNL